MSMGVIFLKRTNLNKIIMVRDHVEKSVSLRVVADKYNLHISGVKYLTALFSGNGETAFLKDGE